jgi:hypothetical protein
MSSPTYKSDPPSKIEEEVEYEYVSEPPTVHVSSTTHIPIVSFSGLPFFITFFILLLISMAAAYLSWSCNTGLGINPFLKVIYAIGAFIGNIGYLMFYFIYRLGICGPFAPKQSIAPVARFGGKKHR